METPAQKRVQPLDQVGRRWSLGREGGGEETDEKRPGRERKSERNDEETDEES